MDTKKQLVLVWVCMVFVGLTSVASLVLTFRMFKAQSLGGGTATQGADINKINGGVKNSGTDKGSSKDTVKNIVILSGRPILGVVQEITKTSMVLKAYNNKMGGTTVPGKFSGDTYTFNLSKDTEFIKAFFEKGGDVSFSEGASTDIKKDTYIQINSEEPASLNQVARQVVYFDRNPYRP